MRIDPRPILVVDDDEYSRLMMVTLLDLKGYSVVTAANGAEALRVARQQLPSLILLDLIMPVMDGVEFRRHQREEPRLRDIPVVCLSARHDARERANELGFAAFLSKPFDLETVIAAVREICPA